MDNAEILVKIRNEKRGRVSKDKGQLLHHNCKEKSIELDALVRRGKLGNC